MSVEKDISVDDLLGELQAEFGKKPKYSDLNAEARKRNKEWHAKNAPLSKGATSFAKAQLEKSAFRNFYDWDSHRMLTIQEAEAAGDHGLPDLEWTPEARVTTVVHQYCATCKNCVQFVGNEYIRFRGRRRRFKELGGGEHDMSPTVLRRAADCDPNLIQFGPADGSTLEDFTEELVETVSRCPGCIAVERQAYALLRAVTEKAIQPQLPGIEPAVNIELPGFDEAMRGVK